MSNGHKSYYASYAMGPKCREPPTSSPTTTPSYQPSARPSSRPSYQPTVAPTIYRPPTYRPTRRDIKDINFISASKNEVASESMAFGLLLTISMIGVVICCIGVGVRLTMKNQVLPLHNDSRRHKRRFDKRRFHHEEQALGPVGVASGVLSSFVSSMPSRIDELEADEEESDSDSSSDESDMLPPLRLNRDERAQVEDHSHRINNREVSKGNRSYRGFNNRKVIRRKNERNDSSRKSKLHITSAQAVRSQKQLRSNKIKSKSASIRDVSRRRSSEQRQSKPDQTELRQSVIRHAAKRRSEPTVRELVGVNPGELGSTVTNSIGQAFSGLSALAEEAIFPLYADDDSSEMTNSSEDSDSGSESLTSQDETKDDTISRDMSESVSSEDETSSAITPSVCASVSTTQPSIDPRQETETSEPLYNTIFSTLRDSAVLTPPVISLVERSTSTKVKFSLSIVANEFEGLSTSRRHRTIHMLLGETMKKIDSLEITAFSPSEYVKKKSERVK